MNSFDEILAGARTGGPKRIAVAGQSNEELAEALEQARDEGLATATIFESPPDAVAAVRAGDADALMKGNVDTQTFMQAVLDRHRGLRGGSLALARGRVRGVWSLMFLTDGGIVLNPTVDEKAKIIVNAIPICNGLGIQMPKVAVLAAVEKENSKMPETIDAAALTKMSLPGCMCRGRWRWTTPSRRRPPPSRASMARWPDTPISCWFPPCWPATCFPKASSISAAAASAASWRAPAPGHVPLPRDTAQTKLNTIALGILLSEGIGKVLM